MSANEPGRDEVAVLRPLTMTMMIGAAFRFVTRAPRTALGIGVIAGFASAMANIVGLGTVYPLVQDRLAAVEPLAADPQAADQTALAAAFVDLMVAAAGMFVLVGLLSAPVLAIANALVIASAGRDVFGEQPSLRTAWDVVRPRLGAVLGQLLVIVATLALCGLPLVVSLSMAESDPVVGLGLSFLLAPLSLVALLMVLPRLVLAPVCLVLEKVGVAVSFVRSRQLAQGSWARIVGIVVVSFLFARLVGAVVGLPFDVFAGADPLSTQAVFFSSLGRMAGSAVSVPLLSATIVMLYTDLRVRGEGFGQG